MKFRALFIAIFAAVSTITSATAQVASDPNEGSRLIPDPANPGVYNYTWFGHSGRTYFLQQSEDLLNWAYLPMLEPGADQTISWGFTSNSPRFFLRLRYTTATGGDPFTTDSDGDGVTDWDELLQGTDPFSAAMDTNGLPIDWEMHYFGHTGVDPNDDPDGDGFTNMEEYLNGTDPTDPHNGQKQAALSVLRGNFQQSLPNKYLALPVMVQATDSSNRAIPNAQVNVSVTNGGGHLSATNTSTTSANSIQLTTDSDGLAFFWYQNSAAWGVSSTITATFTSTGVARNTVIRASTVQASPPANDNFANAQTINGNSGSAKGANAGGTKESGEPNHAQLAGGASIWYAWQAPSTGSFNFNTTGSSFDTILAVYTGTNLSGLNEVVSNNDDDTTPDYSVTSNVVFRATAGTTYYIAVDGFNGQVGSVVLNWTNNAGPSNDYFAAAAPLNGITGTVSGTNVGATREPGEPLHAGQQGKNSVWYSWQASQSGQMMIDTSGSSIDTFLAVYTGSSVQNLTAIASNDDAIPGSDTTSRTSFRATSGQTYYIAIDSPTGISGNYKLNWDLGVAPANDNFANAQNLTGNSGSIVGTNRYASKEDGEPDHYYGYGVGMSVWYTWTAPADGYVYLDASSSNFQAVLDGYTGNSLPALELQSSGYESMYLYVNAGVTYQIAVDGYSYGDTTFGDIAMSWQFTANSNNNSQSAGSHNAAPANPELTRSQQKMAAAAGGATPADEEQCDDPPQPNQGNAGHWVYDANGNQTLSPTETVYVSLPSKGDPACSETVPITHQIVTFNTPRARDLHGKLILTVLSGDPSIIQVSDGGSGYTFGSPIAVTEPGHEGCGVHTWHTGDENFTFVGKAKGTVVLQAEVDPDPDDGGAGQANQKCTITVNVIQVTYQLDPIAAYPPSAKTDWSGQDDKTTTQNVTVVTDPGVDPKLITLTLDDDFVSPYNDSYQPDSTGDLIQDTTNPALWVYHAFKEPKSEKHPLRKQVRVTAHFNDPVNNQYLDLCPHLNLQIATVFNWYANAHQHGPGGAQDTTPTNADYTNAYKYALWKYDLKLTHSDSISYDASLGTDGISDWNGVNHGIIRLGPSVFGGRTSSDYAENWTAATMIHEDWHGSQNRGNILSQKWYSLSHSQHDNDLQFEVPAYSEEKRRGPEVGMSPNDAQAIQDIIDRVNGGGVVGSGGD